MECRRKHPIKHAMLAFLSKKVDAVESGELTEDEVIDQLENELVTAVTKALIVLGITDTETQEEFIDILSEELSKFV